MDPHSYRYSISVQVPSRYAPAVIFSTQPLLSGTKKFSSTYGGSKTAPHTCSLISQRCAVDTYNSASAHNFARDPTGSRGDSEALDMSMESSVCPSDHPGLDVGMGSKLKGPFPKCLSAVVQLPPIPGWGLLFLEWVDLRQKWVYQISEGSKDRVAVNGSLATQFEAWLNPHWPLVLSFVQSFPDHVNNRSRWIHLFDLWAVWICRPGDLHHSLSSTPVKPTVVGPPVLPTRCPGSSMSKHIALESNDSDSGDSDPGSDLDSLGPRSTLTVKLIKVTCKANNVKTEYIKCLKIVFPCKYAYRNQLKKPKGGCSGYGHFTIEGSNGKWVCVLCSPQRELQDRKNALEHIWVLHCRGQRNHHGSQP